MTRPGWRARRAAKREQKRQEEEAGGDEPGDPAAPTAVPEAPAAEPVEAPVPPPKPKPEPPPQPEPPPKPEPPPEPAAEQPEPRPADPAPKRRGLLRRRNRGSTTAAAGPSTAPDALPFEIAVPEPKAPEQEPDPQEPELEAGESGAPAPDEPAKRGRRGRWIWAGLAGVLLLAAIALGLLSAGVFDGDDEDKAAPPKPAAGDTAPSADALAAGPVAIRLADARDYDPLVGDGEHPELAQNAIDGKQGTTWSTEEYQPGQLPQDGVGLYVDAGKPIPAGAIVIETPTPGWNAEVYAATGGPPDKLPSKGWRRVGKATDVGVSTQIALPSERARYYLVWATKLPGNSPRVQISEVRLLDCGRTPAQRRKTCKAAASANPQR